MTPSLAHRSLPPFQGPDRVRVRGHVKFRPAQGRRGGQERGRRTLKVPQALPWSFPPFLLSSTVITSSFTVARNWNNNGTGEIGRRRPSECVHQEQQRRQIIGEGAIRSNTRKRGPATRSWRPCDRRRVNISLAVLRCEFRPQAEDERMNRCPLPPPPPTTADCRANGDGKHASPRTMRWLPSPHGTDSEAAAAAARRRMSYWWQLPRSGGCTCIRTV